MASHEHDEGHDANGDGVEHTLCPTNPGAPGGVRFGARRSDHKVEQSCARKSFIMRRRDGQTMAALAYGGVSLWSVGFVTRASVGFVTRVLVLKGLSPH